MDGCIHENSPQKDWLPMPNGMMRLHPHCRNCGVVKNVSSDPGKGIGYFANSLSRLREFLESKGYRVSQAQMRLILMEFERLGMTDVYSVSFSRQREAFIEIARRYIRISEDVIGSFV